MATPDSIYSFQMYGYNVGEGGSERDPITLNLVARTYDEAKERCGHLVERSEWRALVVNELEPKTASTWHKLFEAKRPGGRRREGTKQ